MKPDVEVKGDITLIDILYMVNYGMETVENSIHIPGMLEFMARSTKRILQRKKNR